MFCRLCIDTVTGHFILHSSQSKSKLRKDIKVCIHASVFGSLYAIYQNFHNVNMYTCNYLSRFLFINTPNYSTGDNAWKIFMYLMKNAKNLDNQNKAMNLTGAIPQSTKSAKFSIIGIVTLQKNEIFSYI